MKQFKTKLFFYFYTIINVTQVADSGWLQLNIGVANVVLAPEVQMWVSLVSQSVSFSNSVSTFVSRSIRVKVLGKASQRLFRG